MAHQLTGNTIASTFEQLIYRTTTQPSTGTTTTQLMTSENDQTDDVGLPLYISTERVGIGTNTSAPSATLHVLGSAVDGSLFVVESTATAADDHAPEAVFYRNANLTDGGNLGLIRYRGLDSAGVVNDYATIGAEIVDETAGTEDGKLRIQTSSGGTLGTRMTILSQDVGIGEESPDSRLHIKSTAGNILKLERTSSTDNVNIEMVNDSGTMYMGLDGGSWIVSNDSDKSSQPALSVISYSTFDTQGALFDGGRVGINTMSPAHNLHIINNSDAERGIYITDPDTGCNSGNKMIQLDYSADSDLDGAMFIDFHDADGNIGEISGDGAATTYATSSDYRLKEDLKEISDASSVINQLKIYDFKWKKADKRAFGVIAHEAQAIIPQAITGEKDGDRFQSADYSKFVPHLIKAVQELSAKVTALESA